MSRVTSQDLVHVYKDLVNCDDVEGRFIPDIDGEGRDYIEIDISKSQDVLENGVLRLSAENFVEFSNLVEFLSK